MTEILCPRCSWCRRDLEATARRDARFCGQKCRQAAWRLRRYTSSPAIVDASTVSVADVSAGS